jgi:hypothetical protein
MDAVKVGGRMGFAAKDSITYDDSSYEATIALASAASGHMSSTPGGKFAAFSEEDRKAAMGIPKKSKKSKQ